MLTRIPNAAVVGTAVLLLGSLGVTGCSTSNNGVVTHTPALQTTGGRDTARSTVEAAWLVADVSNGISLPGGPTPASIARRVFAMERGRRISATGGATGVCINGQKQSQSTGAGGSQTTTTDYYYESTCATLEAEEIITLASPTTPGNTTGTGTITSYSSTGTVRVVQTLTLKTTTSTSATNPGQETFTLTDNAATSAGGTTVSAVGATCVGTPPSATVNCAVAHYGTSAGTTFGEAIGIGATAASAGSTNNTANVNVSFYAATGLGISQSGTSWGVSGANAFNSAAGTYTYTSTGPSGSGSMELKDSLYSYDATATLSSSGLSVTIIQTPNSAFNTTSQILTAHIDVAGTGVLTYFDGTTEPIAGGLIGF